MNDAFSKLFVDEFIIDETITRKDIKFGGDEFGSYIKLKFIIHDKDSSNTDASLQLTKIKSYPSFILNSDDFINIRITKTFYKLCFNQQETDIVKLRLGERYTIKKISSGLTIKIEILPFVPYTVADELTWLQSVTAAFLPLIPPLKYYDPNFKLICFLRRLQNGDCVDYSDIIKWFSPLNAYSITKYQDFYKTKEDNKDRSVNRIQLFNEIAKCFEEETGITFTTTIGQPFEILTKARKNHGMDNFNTDAILIHGDTTFSGKNAQRILEIGETFYHLVSYIYQVNSHFGCELVFFNGDMSQIAHIYTDMSTVQAPLNFYQRESTDFGRFSTAYLYISDSFYKRLNHFKISSPFYSLNDSFKKEENQMYLPEEATFPAIPSFYPVGKSTKSISIPKDFNIYQIFYLENEDLSFTPIPISSCIPREIVKEATKNIKTEIDFIKKFDFYDKNLSDEQNLENYYLAAYRIVKIVANQITTIFKNDSYKIPIPLDGLAVCKIHNFQKIIREEQITRFRFIHKDKYGIVTTTRPPMLYYNNGPEAVTEIDCPPEELDERLAKFSTK